MSISLLIRRSWEETKTVREQLKLFPTPTQACTHLEGQLSCKGELVPLKQPPADVVEGGVCNAVYECVYSAPYVLTGLRRLHSLVENNVKGLGEKKEKSISGNFSVAV